MASMCRSAALAAVRASSLRSQILLPKASPSRLASPLFGRSLASALGTVDSLWPLHNAVASARLISNIAVDSSCWSWPSQGTTRRKVAGCCPRCPAAPGAGRILADPYWVLSRAFHESR
ncbi:uncharacterized protein LOC110112507 isoform X1 [Dendrobium catenatum]|uniref:uncharacterized protein LOC110112507 isoform X1 n=1 Tax=Dendrobium catenatum TaxID=906689 RepID=UPI0010A02AE2|nr:uncharacterized protein LOC110112507 isoform X1 [Dendrobium catenatum]